LPQEKKCNKEYFSNEMLEGIHEECNHGAGHQITKAMKIHVDNSRAHNVLETAEKICKMKRERLVHPPYSLDLTPGDSCCLGQVTTALRNRTFVDSSDVVEALTNLFDSITFNELRRAFQTWIQRLESVIRNCGQYFAE
jgi:hypothetical protein